MCFMLRACVLWIVLVLEQGFENGSQGVQRIRLRGSPPATIKGGFEVVATCAHRGNVPRHTSWRSMATVAAAFFVVQKLMSPKVSCTAP